MVLLGALSLFRQGTSKTLLLTTNGQIRFNELWLLCPDAGTFGARQMIFSQATIAHDKGKPVARRGRKAVSLLGLAVAARPTGPALEIVWLPKAVGENRTSRRARRSLGFDGRAGSHLRRIPNRRNVCPVACFEVGLEPLGARQSRQSGGLSPSAILLHSFRFQPATRTSVAR